MGDDMKTSNYRFSLNRDSIKEIIILLSDIDVKITALNESSSKDFLLLNSNLKDNSKIANDISGNANKLFEILAGKDRNYLLKKLDSFHLGLKLQIDDFLNSVIKAAKILDSMQVTLNAMFIPVKNFNQNLMTLNFLFANLKLNLSYNPDKTEIIQKIDKVIIEIKIIKDTYDSFNEKNNKVKVIVKSVLNFFNEFKEQQNYTLEAILEQIKSSVTILTAKHQEASVQMPILAKKTENYFENVSKIITNLQFHDIIRQKMEHVQQTHKEIIDELNDFDYKDKKTELTEQTKKFLKIRDIAGIQVAQLIYTNQEYQDAIEKITKNFMEIGEDMKVISSMCTSFSGHNPIFGITHFREIENKLEKSVELINQFAINGEEFDIKISNVKDTFIDIKNDLEKTCESRKNFKTNFDEIIEELCRDASVYPELKKLKKQIVEINLNIEEELSQTKKYFEKNYDELYLLETLSNAYKENNFKSNLKQLSENIYSIVNILNENNSSIENILKQNGQLGSKLALDIQSSIEKVKYYDFFEKVIEEIILELNNIYLTIRDDASVTKLEESHESLDKIKERYTMESQRIIHGNVLNEDLDSENDDEIEFF
ncbi:MAG: hypothetical protein JXR51_13040 [Bacteroidales bacterium]|nr:hypothetical protein [Bacteroidales bacterium]MBN2758096.1 hypothetical protein [Bacteroidales bacterium]